VSYVRVGDDSSIYLIGTTYDNDLHVIECCGCLFTPWTDEEPQDVIDNGPDWARGLKWYAEPFPAFTTRAAAISHLDKHRAAGHKVPDYVYERIREDDWLPPEPSLAQELGKTDEAS
jgi:hypothetical protein